MYRSNAGMSPLLIPHCAPSSRISPAGAQCKREGKRWVQRLGVQACTNGAAVVERLWWRWWRLRKRWWWWWWRWWCWWWWWGFLLVEARCTARHRAERLTRTSTSTSTRTRTRTRTPTRSPIQRGRRTSEVQLLLRCLTPRWQERKLRQSDLHRAMHDRERWWVNV
jgi:hypothetical protein